MKKLRFAIFGNTYQAKKTACIEQLLGVLAERDASLLIDKHFYEYLINELNIYVTPQEVIEGDRFSADFVISMGGDGTFLEAARRVGSKGIPILGINMGRLGFLSDYQAEDITSAIEHIYNETFRLEERTVLMVEDELGHIQGYPYALNEVAVLKQDNSSMISIEVEIDGEFLTTYQADGLIVNTSTGSTGYALSVGGPIIVPGTKIIGLVPVAPHSLTVRPLTLSADSEIRMKIKSRSHNFLLSVDGRSESAHEDTIITIKKAPYTVNVLKRGVGSFFSTLREKLMWGADSRER